MDVGLRGGELLLDTGLLLLELLGLLLLLLQLLPKRLGLLLLLPQFLRLATPPCRPICKALTRC